MTLKLYNEKVYSKFKHKYFCKGISILISAAMILHGIIFFSVSPSHPNQLDLHLSDTVVL